jgi:hypothetical protein
VLSNLAALAERTLRWLSGRPPEPPSFEGLIDELFAAWPLDAVEYIERGEELPREAAA